jgi:adenylate kinase family enzyme
MLAVWERAMQPLERVHIFGAAGCGSSTLGQAVARRLECQIIDADDVFWLPTRPPYQARRIAADRARLLDDATRSAKTWVLSGSIVGWGDHLIPRFDLVVFLYLPSNVRLARLKEREQERFGAAIGPGGIMCERHQAFLQWAAGYDTGLGGRTLETDANWLAHLSCPVLIMPGECPTNDQVQSILSSWERSHS